MQLLYAAPYIGASTGGLAKDVPGLCAEMARRGHQVTLFALDDCGSAEERNGRELAASRDGYAMRHFRPLGGWRAFRRWGASPGYIAGMRSAVPNADIIHVYSVYNFSSWLAATSARQASVPYVLEPHGCFDDFVYRHHAARKRLYEIAFVRNNLRKASAVRFLTEMEAQTAARNCGGGLRGIVVPTGIDVEEMTREAISCDLRAYGVEERYRKQLIVFVGRLHRKKGIDLLARAFAEVAARNPLAFLMVVGPDEGMRSEVETILRSARVHDRAVFTGMLTGQAKTALMASARAIAVPSYGENFCNVVIEALALRVPVVITDRVALYPEVAAAGAGLVVGLDERELAQAIARLLADPACAQRMGEKGRSLVEAKFTWKAVGAQMEEAYLRVLGAQTLAAQRESASAR